MSKQSDSKTVEPQTRSRANSASFDTASDTAFGTQTILGLQRAAGNRAVTELLQPNHLNGDTLAIQRKPANGTGEGALEAQADRVETAVAKEPVAGKALLVEDDVQGLQPGQMHKIEFLNALKTSVCTAADQELKGTMWSTMGCPYVERWVNVYSNKDSRAVEQALQKYAPETRSVTSAEQYIPLVTQRVRKGVAVWRKTGEVTDVPPEFAEAGMPGATFEGLVGAGFGALGGLIGKAVSGIGSALSGAAGAIGSGIAGIGRALFKPRTGGAETSGDAAGIQARLQGGHPLDAEVRGKMEAAFGRDFSGVRVHADAKAAQLSDTFNARAFTVGHEVAFGANEYQPGTLIGDALIAHELAHVVQQGNGKTQGAQTKSAAYNALEEDADVAAVGAVVSGWQGAHGTLREIGKQAMPRMRSGLQLQRCSSKPKYPVLDVSGLPEGKIRDATAELAQSDAVIDRNTARQLVEGKIRAYYFEDLRQPGDIETKLKGYGLDPAIYTIYLAPDNGEEMVVQKNYIGTRKRNIVFGKRANSLQEWKETLVHETSHALNPADLSKPFERYKTEFRAYWVTEFRHIKDLDERARIVREHILREYVVIKNAYNSDRAVKTSIDSYTRPEGDLTNVTGLNPPGTGNTCDADACDADPYARPYKMRFVPRGLPLVVLFLLTVCQTDISTSMQTPTAFDLNQAEQRVRERVATIPPLVDSDIVHDPDLDVPGWYAFSVMPRSIGLAGEVIYLVGANEMLTAGTPADFNRIMQELGVGAQANVLEIQRFAHLFLRLRVLRHGVVLEKPDGHPLLAPGALPAKEFSPPQYRFDGSGANYRFWVLDTDRHAPGFWDVQVAPDGTTTFTEKQR